MARFNEILAGRLNRALQKFTGIKGAAPTPQLATEFIPTLPFFWGVENRVLESWQRYAVFFNITATAAQVGQCRLNNHPATNVLGVIEKIQVVNTNASNQLFSVQQNYATNNIELTSGGITASGLDNRLNPTSVNNNIICSFTNTGGAGLGGNIMQAAIPANTTFDFILFEDHEVTLLPSGALSIFIGVVNLGFNVTIIWRERLLEESERTA